MRSPATLPPQAPDAIASLRLAVERAHARYWHVGDWVSRINPRCRESARWRELRASALRAYARRAGYLRGLQAALDLVERSWP